MSNRFSRKIQHGMTMIELVMAIVIISVGLAGLMLVFTNVVKSSGDPLIRKQMLAIAEQMMEEVSMKQFSGTTTIAAAACARDTWIGLQDYYNLATSVGYDTSKANCLSAGAAVATPNIYDVTGTVAPELSGYSVAVKLDNPARGLSSSTAGNNVVAANVIRITVTVTHGADTIVLLGWRTNYAS